MKWPGVPGITETLLFATPDAVAGVINRTARVYVPRQYNLDRATPVVLDFHGYSSNAANQVGVPLLAMGCSCSHAARGRAGPGCNNVETMSRPHT